MSDLLVINDEEDVPPPPGTDHLLMLGYRLKGLITVLAKKLKQPAVAHYCRLLANTVEAMAPFYRVEGLLPLGVIDRDDSGFPCTRDLLFLFEEWRAAERGLRDGVSEPELLARMRQKIFAGTFPEEEFASLARRHHMLRIHGAEIAEEFTILHPIMLKETEALRFTKLGWRGWDPRAGLFRFCSAIFAQERGTRPLGDIRKESPLYERFRTEFQRPLPEMVEMLMFREDVQPKSIDRYTIGPYHTPAPEQPAYLQGLFEGLEHPFILKLGLERVIIGTSTQPQHFVDDLMGELEERPMHLIEQRTRYVLCNPELRERLHDADERGEPATIFTLGRRGEIG